MVWRIGIRQCSRHFLTRMQHHTDRTLDKFELYAARNIFGLPETLPRVRGLARVRAKGKKGCRVKG